MPEFLFVYMDQFGQYRYQRSSDLQFVTNFNASQKIEIESRLAGLRVSTNLTGESACELIATISTVQGMQTVMQTVRCGSVAGYSHAEEELCRLYRTGGPTGHVFIHNMFITLQPCHSGRYPNHQCLAYFTSGVFKPVPFQNSTGVLASYVPVFCLQGQLAVGDKSIWSTDLKTPKIMSDRKQNISNALDGGFATYMQHLRDQKRLGH